MTSSDQTNSPNSPSSEYEKWKQHIIDIEKKTKVLKTTKCSIYKVPCTLSKVASSKDAYTPQLISIGPIHHGLEHLNQMQEQKLRYLEFFWSPVNIKIEDMDEFKGFLENRENDIRQCYAENLCGKMDKGTLVNMMLLDSAFIMELFLRIQRQKSEDDIILKQSWLNKSIQRDLLLLENQIPLFILEQLYTVVPASDPVKKKHPTFIQLARAYFDCFRTNKKCDEETGSSDFNGKPSEDETIEHFTDLIRSFYICEGLDHDLRHCKKESFLCCPKEKKEPSIRTATKLREAGVSFEKVSNKHLLDIKFEIVPFLSWFLCLGCLPKSSSFKARLQIPELKVNYTTECVFRNLIAFEQCHYPDRPYICNYVSFIDSLIHTKDDVELLVEKEVIVHELGSHKEVATLVNSLCKHVFTDQTCYEDHINSLNKHYQRQWNRTMAALRLVYFRDAWRASSTLVATAVLVFTIFNFCRVVTLVLHLEGGKRP